jgi:hypothetical protein
MIGTGHLLIGGAIGVGTTVLVPAPLAAPAALGLGVLSHHLLDLVPHTDAATFVPEPNQPAPPLLAGVAVVESILGIVLTIALYLGQHRPVTFLVGAIGGMLPDLCDEIPLWQSRFRQTVLGSWWHRWHERLHCGTMLSIWPIGLVIDGCVVGTGLWLLLA